MRHLTLDAVNKKRQKSAIFARIRRKTSAISINNLADLRKTVGEEIYR